MPKDTKKVIQYIKPCIIKATIRYVGDAGRGHAYREVKITIEGSRTMVQSTTAKIREKLNRAGWKEKGRD